MNTRFSLLCIIAALFFFQSEKAVSQVGLLSQSVDYGTCLYGTTRDSFVVVMNTGAVPLTIERLYSFGPDSAYFRAYPIGQGYRDPATDSVIEYPDTFIVIQPTGSIGDAAKYPYRFLPKKLGANNDSILIENITFMQPAILLYANAIQPHLWSHDVNVYFTRGMFHDTSDIVAYIGNSGTASLTIDTITLMGPDSSAWKILSIKDSLTGDTIAWQSSHVNMPPNDIWDITLQFKPPDLGSFNAVLYITGYDSLGRHSNDSVNSFYKWGKFPYDTTMNINATVYGFIGAAHEQWSANSSGIILSQNYPNPANSATTFTFSAPQQAQYSIDIYNALGARIVSLPASEALPGKYAAAWNASGWASGVYYYRVSAGANDNFSGEAKSFLLLR